MELIELWKLFQDAEADRIVEVGRLATLVGDVSKVLEDFVMPPISWIPWDPCTTGDIWAVVDIILECMKEACDSGHDPWD
jgi:hypothetical protein